jgi:SAM-dependent methyltransferase
MDSKERVVADAFDGQAARFERAPLQADAAALERLVGFAALPPGSRVLDGGCGPGLVAEAFLAAGHEVVGVDLSAEMVRRARQRCERFGGRARFQQGAMAALDPGERFDGAVSRLVLHHVADPLSFVTAQRDRLRPGGVLLVCDHITDPDPAKARWHHEIEIGRDVSHERCLTSGALVDLFARLGLERVGLVEEPRTLDFDEWFDRGTPGRPKADVRALALSGTARGFGIEPRPDGGISIHLVWTMVRGVVPARARLTSG